MSYAEAIRKTPSEVTPETVQAMHRLFAPAHLSRTYQAPVISRDLAYGTDERHRLDVHRGAETSESSPVLLFVHGGGFIAGEKRTEGSPYYDHVGGWAAERGFVGVTVNYRLAPAHPWPSGSQDVAAAVEWIRDNITAHGGDPERIVVAGHSAGASHVAGYLAGHGGTPPHVAAAVLLSGIYTLRDAERNPLLRAYYGGDPALYEAREPLAGLVESGLPVLYGVAEYDPPDFQEQAAAVIAAHFARHGAVPAFAHVQGHHHISEIVSLGIDEPALGVTLEHFIRRSTS
ncbi:alpha/beta hydrolase family protein [Actinocorallia herbida]|uniref:Alpha/beta hydrolase family protein n=1 Tax=Actinocorallia herbida TaxID=58109 RepID=A0A3N1D224_9ACTN|nr:alpha/beta hydrolase [Actinocorallia herbida]ROO87589.1 alpha/beta hydrolase family protein [Actinocorallia herbida]